MLGVRKALPTVRIISKVLTEHGFVILTPHVLEDKLDIEKGVSPREIYERDIMLLKKADVCVAEISFPSLGVGFEIAYALLNGKPVIALCRRDRVENKSALIRGIIDQKFRLITYENPKEAAGRLISTLKNLELDRV